MNVKKPQISTKLDAPYVCSVYAERRKAALGQLNNDTFVLLRNVAHGISDELRNDEVDYDNIS